MQYSMANALGRQKAPLVPRFAANPLVAKAFASSLAAEKNQKAAQQFEENYVKV
jgi:hypothetical protein